MTEKRNIMIQTMYGDLITEATEVAPGLAVHQLGDDWVVTHITSGLQVAHFSHERQAVSFILEAGPLADWSQASHKLMTNKTLTRKVEQVMERWYALPQKQAQVGR